MSDVMIRLQGVSKVFPGAAAPAVGDLSLEVHEGEIAVLVGPSGCGKTTILKMINRLIEPSSGRIEVAGRDARAIPVHELRRSIGYVIQQVGLFPHRTIAENIATVPHLLGWSATRVAERIDELVDLMGLEPAMKDRYPAELSGGQRQRAGVARALAADPPVLLMDEPFGAVDPLVRARLQRELLALQERVNKTIVVVTHDIDEAILLGDRVALLNLGGVLEQYDTPATILGQPANAFVASFLGAGRGLKRLSLIAVADVSLDHGPVLDVSASIEDAKRTLAQHDSDWVGVLDGERLRGWLWAEDLIPDRTLGEHDTREFRTRVQADRSLRDALDAVVSSRHQVAIVEDGDGRYRGMLQVASISRELTS